MDVVYRDGKRHLHAAIANISASSTPPPSSVLQQHVLWNEAAFPSFESPVTANAVVDCGAKGDGVSDDEPALSACLAKHTDVFLPKGFFRLGKTLELNPGNRLVSSHHPCYIDFLSLNG